jgi:anti-sigma regulatory factor (Ser/Thr protein kinase)
VNVPRARRELRRDLVKWGLPELADTAEVVLGELLTNAIRHARSPAGRHIETRYEMTDAGLRIEVHDANLTVPVMPPETPSENEESGRGLALVAALTGGRCGFDARRAGIDTGIEIGKTAWAVIPTGGQQR